MYRISGIEFIKSNDYWYLSELTSIPMCCGSSFKLTGDIENCIIKSDNNELKESEKILHKYYNLEDLGIYVIELIQAYIW